ncbi:hypothetical protein KCTC52924_00550 [Arenibacter antarcticus]
MLQHFSAYASELNKNNKITKTDEQYEKNKNAQAFPSKLVASKKPNNETHNTISGSFHV